MSLDLNKNFISIIDRKHKDLNLGQDYNKKFSKIKDFEGNAIGQIGESFLKIIISSIAPIQDDGTIHDEYDICTKSGKYFEVKTARRGRQNNTFQFNGINPNYNYNYLICLGLTEDALFYRIFLKSDIQYIHKKQRHFVIQGDFKAQLVQMNPNNLVNQKLTLSNKHLYPISNIISDLKELLN